MSISEIKTQEETMNTGSKYGQKLLNRSIKQLGLTRGIVVDKNNVVLCGDKVLKETKKLGINKIHVIETTGDTLVVVKRTDIDAKSRKGLDIQLIDNLASEQNLRWDAKTIIKMMNVNLAFNPYEWNAESCLVEELDLEEYLKQETEKIERSKSKENETTMILEDIVQTSLFE